MRYALDYTLFSGQQCTLVVDAADADAAYTAARAKLVVMPSASIVGTAREATAEDERAAHPKRRWELTFTGRPIGSLSPLSAVRVVTQVNAPNLAIARHKAYETHEHISGGDAGVRAVELEPGDPVR